MTQIRVIYRGQAPDFPPSAQHADAQRLSTTWAGEPIWVDYVGDLPGPDDIDAVLNPA